MHATFPDSRFRARPHLPLALALLAGGAWAAGTSSDPLRGGNIPLKTGAEPLLPAQVSAMQEAFDANPRYRIMQNAAAVTPLEELALDHAIVTRTVDSFSHKIDDWPVTSQNRSGRCWLFAGTNLLRVGAMKRMNVTRFEFSQNYLFFWHKLERANYFLEAIIDTADRPDGDRTVDFLLDHPISDGGQWNMFAGLVAKYGLVPKTVMPETESSSDSAAMNRILRARLRRGARRLRDLHRRGAAAAALRAAKHEMLTVIHRILCIHLGTPPRRFSWQWRDKDKVFHRDGEMTPKAFAKRYVAVDPDEYVCLVHDPRPSSPVGRTFTVAYLGNMVGGEPVTYLNIGMDLMKRMAARMVAANEPVWFGCDCGPQMSRELGIWDEHLFDYGSIYDTDFDLGKADRLIYHQSRMNHAMLFTGLDIVGGKPRRWRVENSWGPEAGRKGFFVMNDSWFDAYVFEIAAPRRNLPQALQEALEREPIVLPPWDPMGSLAEFGARAVPAGEAIDAALTR